MLFDDTYKELEFNSIGFYKEKGSKFFAYSYLVYNESDIKKKLEQVKKTEKSANHYCYAYVLYPDKSACRFSDDGEPPSTAGKPILRQIQSNNLTNILIIVVRYFGGIKLGIPGLIRSYKTAATNSIKKTKIMTKIIKEQYEVIFKYSETQDVMKIINEFNLEIVEKDFQMDCKILLQVSKKRSNNVLSAFKKNHKLIIKYQKTV